MYSDEIVLTLMLARGVPASSWDRARVSAMLLGLGDSVAPELVAGRSRVDCVRQRCFSGALALLTDDTSDRSLSGTEANSSELDSELDTRGLSPGNGLTERALRVVPVLVERVRGGGGAAEVGLGVMGLNARCTPGRAVWTESPVPAEVDGRPFVVPPRGCPDSNPCPFGFAEVGDDAGRC